VKESQRVEKQVRNVLIYKPQEVGEGKELLIDEYFVKKQLNLLLLAHSICV
jgi:hypothetical protein